MMRSTLLFFLKAGGPLGWNQRFYNFTCIDTFIWNFVAETQWNLLEISISHFQAHFKLLRSGLTSQKANQNLQDEIEKGSFTQLPQLMIFGILGFLLSSWGSISVSSARSCAKAKTWCEALSFKCLWYGPSGSSDLQRVCMQNCVILAFRTVFNRSLKESKSNPFSDFK